MGASFTFGFDQHGSGRTKNQRQNSLTQVSGVVY